MNRLFATLATLMFVIPAYAPLANAHDPGLSSLRIDVLDESIETTLRIATSLLTPASDFDGALGLMVDDTPLERRSTRLETLNDEQSELRLEFVRSEGETLRITSRLLAAFPPGHKQFVQVASGDSDVVASRILTEGEASFAVSLPDLARSRSIVNPLGATSFFWIGVEHIATGFDHLLFLAALLLASGGLGSAARIITAFTIAHSLTLIAAISGVIEFNPTWVESLIAASIVFAAALNLMGGHAVHRRVGVALGFGLIHGLGFAGLLEQLDLTGAGISFWPLIGFNLGVEAGQLAFAVPLLAAIAWLRRRTHFQQRLVPALSVLIGAFGLIWLAERTALL